MPESRSNSSWARQLIMKLLQLPSTNSNLLSTCEEDAVGEVDEPPDNVSVRVVHPGYHSDGEFTKRAIVKPTHHTSLLTQALTSPELAPVDRAHFSRNFRDGFSGTSIWSLSGASTAELTSDGGLSSRSHSPSPPHPPMLPPTFGLLYDTKAGFAPEKRHVEVVGESDALEALGRKRSIRFACQSPLHVREQAKKVESQVAVAPSNPPRRTPTIKFACSQRDDKADQHSKPHTHFLPSSKIQFASINLSGSDSHHHETKSTVAECSTPKAIHVTRSLTSIQRSTSNISPSNPATRFYEFASSVEETEPWMQHPPHGSRLLRVDGGLEKEKDIRRLTEEAEEEQKQEEGEGELEDEVDTEEEEGDNGVEVDDEEDEDLEHEDDQDDEFDMGDYDDFEDEDDEDDLSGNESDNEEGFASDDDDEDDSFFHFTHLPIPSPMLPRRPTCCRSLSESSVASSINTKYGPAGPSKADLPDSTDFVCGTLDEDKEVEDAYLSALEEKKRARRRITPHDIDPSFPVSDSDDGGDNGAPASIGSYHWVRGRTSSSDESNAARRRNKFSILKSNNPQEAAAKIRFQSPTVPHRNHSPAPKRRMISPPPPASRRGSKHTTPSMSRRNSNEQSPRPTFIRRGSRCMSPAPTVRSNLHPVFSPRANVEKTRSLPRNIRGSNRAHSPDDVSTGPSPKGVPIGARCSRKPRRRDGCGKLKASSWTRRGEGVEKMREVGLMLGKGKPPPPWLSSI